LVDGYSRRAERNQVLLGGPTLDGPGEEVPEITEGLSRREDLPAAKIKPRSRIYKKRPCPECGHSSSRDKIFARTLHDLGDLGANRPVDLGVRYSRPRCSSCHRYCKADLTDLADPGGHSTRRVVHWAVRLVVEEGLPDRTARGHLWRDPRVLVPFAPLPNWGEAGGKRSRRIDHP